MGSITVHPDIAKKLFQNYFQDKTSSHDSALKQYEDQMNSKMRKLEARVSELQRTNEAYLHLKVSFLFITLGSFK